MILTKQRYGKEDGYIAWHGYQSFKPGEVTPEQCHALGVELARQMWGDRFQGIVTTHLDKEHLHNHFCINSVSFKDGGKYNFSKKELKRLRDTSDRLCREHGLSVVEHPRKAPSRQVWLDEQAGNPPGTTSTGRISRKPSTVMPPGNRSYSTCGRWGTLLILQGHA